MINGINAATPAPNAIPNVDEGNNKVQENQGEISNVQAEDHTESAQRDNEANAKPPADQNESRGTALDVFG